MERREAGTGFVVRLRLELGRVKMAVGACTYGGTVRFGFGGGLEVLWLEQVKLGQAGSLLGGYEAALRRGV